MNFKLSISLIISEIVNLIDFIFNFISSTIFKVIESISKLIDYKFIKILTRKEKLRKII